MTTNVDNEKNVQISPISRYIKRIWTNVIVYTLLDTFAALIILISIYIPVLLVYFITRSILNINIRLITFSFFVLTLLYMLSIIIVSWWHHYLIVKPITTKQSQPVDARQSNQNTQSSEEKSGGEIRGHLTYFSLSLGKTRDSQLFIYDFRFVILWNLLPCCHTLTEF